MIKVTYKPIPNMVIWLTAIAEWLLSCDFLKGEAGCDNETVRMKQNENMS